MLVYPLIEGAEVPKVKSNLESIPYPALVQKLTVAIYFATIIEASTHPMFRDWVKSVIMEARSFSTMDRVERDTIASLQSAAQSVLSGETAKPININDYERSLYKYDAEYSTLIPEFYKPLFATISRLPYTGEAVAMSIILDGFSFFTELTNKYYFDNTFFVVSESVHPGKFWAYFGSFNLEQLSFDQLISYFFSKVALPSKEYKAAMSFGEICRAVDSLSYGRQRDALGGYVYCRDLGPVAKMLTNISKHQNKLNLEESYYFPLIAHYLGLTDLCINYVMKKSNGTVEEYDAFMNSFLSGYVREQPESAVHESKGLEAAEDDLDLGDVGDDDPSDEEDDSTDEDSDETETDDSDDEEDDSEESDDEEDEDSSDGETEEDTDTPSSDTIPSNEPAFISLELSENESLSDILYKFRVIELVSSYQEDPPTELSSEELLLLEVWCARWIFLVSARATEQLLSTLKIEMVDS